MPYIGLSGVSPAKAFGWGSYQVTGDLGAMIALQSITTGFNGVTEVVFRNIPQTYTHLQIRAFCRNSSSYTPYDVDNIDMTFNGDTGNNYSSHRLSGNGTSPSSGNTLPRGNLQIGVCPFSNSLANSFGSNIIDILDYASTSKTKVARSFWGFNFNGNSSGAGQDGGVGIMSGVWNNTAAITQIRLVSGTYNTYAQNTSIALYGIKGV